MGCAARLQEGRPCLWAIVEQTRRLERQTRHYRRYCSHTRIPHAPFRPFPSRGTCMVQREGSNCTRKFKHRSYIEPDGYCNLAQSPSTSQTTMDRIQTEPSTLHQTDCSAPLNRNLQTTESHYSRIQSAGRTDWSRTIYPWPQCRVVCRYGVGRNPS